jgi:hypothetical protein
MRACSTTRAKGVGARTPATPTRGHFTGRARGIEVLIFHSWGVRGVARADAQPRQQARAQPANAPPKAATDTAQQLEIYGFAQADMIYDFKQNDPNWFDVNRPTKLPAFTDEFGRDGRTWLSARQTRFGVKGTTRQTTA